MSQKVCEFSVAHFAGSDAKVPVMNGAEARSMPIDPDVEGRIGKDHRASLALHEHRVAFRVEAIPAEDAMPAETPKIAGLADLDCRLRLGQFVCGVAFTFSDRSNSSIMTSISPISNPVTSTSKSSSSDKDLSCWPSNSSSQVEFSVNLLSAMAKPSLAPR